MANRYPLILDTTDGNKIKELPENDNLYLRTNSIEEVQDINALGTINAADITIAGQRLQAQSILDLTDTPSTLAGQANQVLKVNATEDGIDFVDIADIGDITAGTITITGNINPDQTATSNLGNSSKQFNEIQGRDLYGNLRGYDGTLVFDADNNQILYAAIVGAPDSLSEFTNDVGYITLSQVSTYIENNLTISNFKGSVFADDSSVMVDAVNFTMFSDVMNLTPLNTEPEEPISGMLVAADGVNWDPATKSGTVAYPVFYDGTAWNALY